MASSDEEAAAMHLKISQLTGTINRVKNGSAATHTPAYPAAPYYAYSPAWNQARGRGGHIPRGSRGHGRGRGAPVYRNKCLVLNGPENQRPTNDGTDAESSNAPGFVAKTGRHHQLINKAFYEQHAQTLTKAMEETRKQKLKQRDQDEKTKINNHLQRVGGTGNDPATSRDIFVQGIKFRISENGSKLTKVSDDPSSAKATPKMASIGRVKFHRTKNGNMYRAAIVKDHRRNAVIRKINEPCKAFSTTGSSFHSSASLGPFHGRGGHIGLQLTRSIIGTCLKSQCRYIHDPTKVAACKTFLLKGSCPSGDSCDLSHDLTPERTPSCLHFSRGNCNKEDCRYIHVRVSPSAPVCRSFGIYGYCEKGADCEDRHVHECPDFSNTGKCDSKGCKLIHVRKAHVMRNIVNTEDSDMSSDEDGEDIDSDDVDSDDLEELLGDDDGVVDTDVTAQRDYMGF